MRCAVLLSGAERTRSCTTKVQCTGTLVMLYALCYTALAYLYRADVRLEARRRLES